MAMVRPFQFNSLDSTRWLPTAAWLSAQRTLLSVHYSALITHRSALDIHGSISMAHNPSLLIKAVVTNDFWAIGDSSRICGRTANRQSTRRG
jgi:hypothetical protein